MAAKTIFFLLVLLSATSPATAEYLTAGAGDRRDSFVECIVRHSAPSVELDELLHFDNATSGDGADDSFSSIFLSNIANRRFATPASPKPIFLITPSNEEEVRAAVICCRSNCYPIRIRSGGHDYEGLSSGSLCSDGVAFAVVDLSRIRHVSVDAELGTARVGSGATLGELYYAAAEGTGGSMGFPAGYCPYVGVGGHLSGGGFGTLVRKYGVGADHVLDARIVVADGRILDRSSMGEDLFWAIRGGGGGSFGVVVEWEVRLVAVAPAVAIVTFTKSAEQEAIPLLTKWQSIAPKLHEDIFLQAALKDVAGGSVGGVRAIFNIFSLVSCDELLDALTDYFPELAPEAKQGCNEVSWIESVVFFSGYGGDPPPPPEVLLDPKMHVKWSFKAKTDFVREPMLESAWETLWRECETAAAAGLRFDIYFDPYGGRMEEVAESATPFPHRRGVLFNIQYIVGWYAGAAARTEEESLSWVRLLHDAMEPYVSKDPREAYVNFKDLDIGRNRGGDGGGGSGAGEEEDEDEESSFSEAEEAWGKKYFMGNFRRLARVKARVDPENYFRDEQSIPVLKDDADGTEQPAAAAL